MNRFKNRRARRRVEKNMPEGHVLCATIDHDGVPQYFSMPADAPEGAVWRKAFYYREGRAPTRMEITMFNLANAYRGDLNRD